MKITQFLSYIPFKKYLAGLLVSVILISQTIHVDFFDRVQADMNDYRDIVSIIVDKETYTSESTRILRYAKDVSGYLGETRTSIFIVDKNTPASVIAAKNEKLYYEGDDTNITSNLVGTVLIGNIPIPMVTKDGTTFPSLFPYVDFDNKVFVYSAMTDQYIFDTNNDDGAKVADIWHGIINPAVGRNWSGTPDIAKIGQFLDKTHDFYSKSGKFSLSTIPPKVFYYDGLVESKSINLRSLFQYSLNIQNAENIAYNRFTKYLLRDITASLQLYDKKTEDPDVNSLYASLGIPQGSDTLSEDQIKKLPDAQSKKFLLGFLKNFKGIFNEKTLGEELLAVHNAGRYTSGATVRADLVPVSISVMDDVARATLKTSNQAMVTAIEGSLNNGIASKIIIFDKNIVTDSGMRKAPRYGVSMTGYYMKEYKNYFFGSGATTVSDPSQCTIARGFANDASQFGRSVRVEANTAFDLRSAQGHIDILKQDTNELIGFHQNPAYSCFDVNTSVAKTKSYWGDNSILILTQNINNVSSPDGFLFDPSPATSFSGFNLPIFSLGGMKESSRIDDPSIANCIQPKYQYTLVQPHSVPYRVTNQSLDSYTYNVAFPSEWNQYLWGAGGILGGGYIGPGYNNISPLRFTCHTVHQVGAPISVASSISDYASRPCFAGTMYLNGTAVQASNRTCISEYNNYYGLYEDGVAYWNSFFGLGGPSSWDSDSNVINGTYYIDITDYEDRYYHTIPSVWSHVSPTDEEISAAKTNGITPSLPVDQTRFVEFLTPKGNIARINYPNFFELQGDTIQDVRNWLTNLSATEWQRILNTENSTAMSADRTLVNHMVSPGILPTSPPNWNVYISDEMIQKILQAKKWLHPDISLKYRRAIESLLSYSGAPIINGTAPNIPTLGQEYEIAYLGLPASFDVDFSHGDSSTAQAAYDTRLREIEGLNISDESRSQDDQDNNPATDCGPPDGVPLLQWPSAIICWMQKQLPPRILAGSCGATTIGLDPSSGMSHESPSNKISQDSSKLIEFYSGSKLVPHLLRKSMGLRDTMVIDVSLQKNGKILDTIPNTTAHLQVDAINVEGKTITNSADYDKYMRISPDTSIVGEKGSSFIIESLGTTADITLKAYYSQPLPNESINYIYSSSFDVEVTPEYFLFGLTQSGTSIANINAVSTDSVSLDLRKVNKDGTVSQIKTPVRIEIIDDIDGKSIFSGASFNPSQEDLPPIITKKVGVYRLFVEDSNNGIDGEFTFAVEPGPLFHLRMVPVSTILVRGNRTLANIRLLDRLNNPIYPDIHSLKLDIVGGYFVDANGDKKDTMTMDIMTAQIPIIVGSDSPGALTVTATVDNNLASGNMSIPVYNTASIVLKPDAVPKVGSNPITAHIEVQDETNHRIAGLSTIATWKFPDNAGSFSKEVITITDGVSETFDYIPGTVSGNHALTIDIPGVGSVSDIIFPLLPGDPLYISHTKDENNIIFSLRDRYNNIATQPASISGTGTRNNNSLGTITFQNGIYSLALKGGYYDITVPGLKNYSISYTEKDTSGAPVTRNISGIDRYETYISNNDEKIDFAPDYNARYTVLAGNSFLNEGEDILYNVTPGLSQSLAVTTLLDSSRRSDTLFSLLPGGAYHLGTSSQGSSVQSSISLLNGFPLLTVSEIVTGQQVAKVRYQMQNATLEKCQQGPGVSCFENKSNPTIRLITPEKSDLTMSFDSNKILLNSQGTNIFSIQNDGSVSMLSNISLVPKDSNTLGLGINILQNGNEIATLIIMTDSLLSVERSNPSSTQVPRNTPVILSSGFSIEKIYGKVFQSNEFGYKIFQTSKSSELDESKSGPDNIDGIGLLSEVEKVGWTGNNTMLLTYAGGDTVGESTRFFHTYTMVNLGDPVTHVEHNRPGTEIEGIDRALGSLVARGNHAGITKVFHKDMDNDQNVDLVVLYQDGYMELLLNRGGKFRSKGMIVYNKDLDPSLIELGDFKYDGYSDIIGLNQDRDLVLIDNSNRRFSRVNITLDGGDLVPHHITQFRIYDMDADRHDDIVYLSAGGELGVLYGTDTPGTFTKKVLDSALGITLSSTPITTGGAIRADSTPDVHIPAQVVNNPTSSVDDSILIPPTQTVDSLDKNSDEASALDDHTLQGEVYYQYAHQITMPTQVSLNPKGIEDGFSNIKDGAVGNTTDTFVRSQYAGAYGLDIQKTYSNVSHTMLYPDDLIQARITIHNTTNHPIKNIEYLDTIPKIFSLQKTQKYTIKIGNGGGVDRDFESIGDNEYDMYFRGQDIPAGETLEITYELTALPASYGEMMVGDLERGTVGHDPYGDVGFETSATCGASILLWSSGPGSRDYDPGKTHDFGVAKFPDGLESRLADNDNNGVPDSVENMSLADREAAYAKVDPPSPKDSPLMKVSQNGGEMTIGFDEEAVDSMLDSVEELLVGLSCGFGGGGCMNFPLNWAPLAPGSSLSIMGIPATLPLMQPYSGIPTFSAPTTLPTPFGPVPAVWPPVVFGAGGAFGPAIPYTSIFRIFVTPTLTLGMGTAICGGPSALGFVPPIPLIQGGNCIVLAAPMPFCKGDGSIADGDVSAISGLGTLSDTWNASSCKPKAKTNNPADNQILTTNIVNYLKNPDKNQLKNINTGISNRGAQSLTMGPLLQIGNPSSGGASVSLEIDSNFDISNIGSVIKLKNIRVAAFPDFLMRWLSDQKDEIFNSLFTPPNLTIILPTDFGQNAHIDSSFENFTKKLGDAYSTASINDIKQGMNSAFHTKTNTPGIPDSLQSTAQNVKGTLNSIKAAYTMIGKLPFIKINQINIPLNIPWISMTELNKYYRAYDGYIKEFDRALKNLCITDTSLACADNKLKIQSGPFIHSIRENLKRIEEYKRFPTKILKYLTWKERYVAQILCNINTIQQITGGWLRDNGIRFRKWAELIVLIRAIAEGWQPLFDIFTDTSRNCGVCHNQRYSLQYWLFKLVSMVLPTIPVITFPKWPDIVLDLSDVRFAIVLGMPNFDIRLSPIRLPNLPSLSIGDISATLSLPALPIIPALPNLPDLPDLPSLPKVKLPDLPPPPKLPKLFAALEVFLKIIKIISRVYCLMNSAFLVPEWRAGDLIAQRTERQGTFSLDFLNLNLPQFSLPSIKEIRISTHVNFEMRSDFIAEFARSAVKPINKFNTDLQNIIPSQIGKDVNIPGANINLNKTLNYQIEKDVHAISGKLAQEFNTLEQEKDVYLEIDEFISQLSTALRAPEFGDLGLQLQKKLSVARIESKKTQDELITYNNTKFDLLRDYVNAENDNNAILRNIIDLLMDETPGESRQLIADITTSTPRSTELLGKFNTFQNTFVNKIDTLNTGEDSMIDIDRKTFEKKFDRMIAATTGGPASTNGSQSSNIPEGYSPNYQGIYIHTPSGIQTQLFDYTGPLTDDTQVDTLDIDGDGDTDYIYILDGNVYVKYSWLHTPTRNIDNTQEITHLTSNDLIPYVPNYFHDNFSTPKSLTFSFTPAYQDETEWRAEFYDRYIEWDHADIGSDDPRTIPKTIVDMLLEVPKVPTAFTGIISIPVRRSILSVGDKASFRIQGRSIDVYTGALSISLSPGRVLYTGTDGVTITYTNESAPSGKTITLDPYTGYEFSESTEITTQGGKLYLIGSTDGSLYTYSDDLIGMPLLTDMQIYASDGGAKIKDHNTGNTDITLLPSTSYITYDLGEKSEKYEVSLPYPNGYYYARISNITKHKTDRAGVILLAPQASSDDGAPIIGLPAKIRLPIYSTKTYQISDILTDLSNATLTIDSDLTIDSNGNGIFDDDFSSSGTGFSLSQYDLTFGKFDTPGNYDMLLKAIDEMGNATIIPITVEAYTPIPNISNVTSSGYLNGSIPESVLGMPIHFFRVRPGETPKILSTGSTLTDTGGVFLTGSFFKTPEIINLKAGGDNGTVTSHGAFILPTGYHIEVQPLTASNPMRLLMRDQSNSIVHIHTIFLPDNTVFIDGTKNLSSNIRGIVVTPTPSSALVPALTKDTSNPGGVYITDTVISPPNNPALVIIDRDGNISIPDSSSTALTYSVSPLGYIMITVLKGGTSVATIEYRIDFFYTMK